MWNSLNDIALCERTTIHELASRIYSRKKHNESLSSAIRVFLTLYYRDKYSEFDKQRKSKDAGEQYRN